MSRLGLQVEPDGLVPQSADHAAIECEERCRDAEETGGERGQASTTSTEDDRADRDNGRRRDQLHRHGGRKCSTGERRGNCAPDSLPLHSEQCQRDRQQGEGHGGNVPPDTDRLLLDEQGRRQETRRQEAASRPGNAASDVVGRDQADEPEQEHPHPHGHERGPEHRPIGLEQEVEARGL